VSAHHTARLGSDFGLPAARAPIADSGAFALFGIPVRFDLSCAFATALGTWTFAGVILPAAAPGRSLLAYWTGGAAAALLTMMSIVGHEVGHAIAARRAGIRVRRMALSLFGGVTELVQTPWTPGVAFRIAIAGPLASTVLAVAAAIGHVVLVEADADPLTSAILALAAVANVAIAAINLLPGLPLDGGHVVAAALWRFTGQPADAGRSAATLGRLLGLGMIAIAIIASASGDAGLALWLVLFGVVIWRGAEPPAYATRPVRAPGTARATAPARPARAA
jgi:Zn-dependent protease